MSAVVTPDALDSGGNATGIWNPQEGRLEIGSIEYVSGGGVSVRLVTDGCTQLQSIQIGSATLTPAMNHSGVQPNFYWYNSIDTQNDSNSHAYLIRLGLPTVTDGSTDAVTFTVVRTGGTGTATYSFSVVYVGLVEPALASTSIAKSGTEIHNEFAAALQTKFPGPHNSATFSGTTVDYDPASLGTYIDSTGIWFSFRLKSEGTCKPVISVTGTFVLQVNAPDHAGLSVRWVNPATAKVEDTLCTVAGGALAEIAHWITAAVVGEGGGVDSIEQELTQAIMGSLPDTSAFNLLLVGSSTGSDQLFVTLKLAYPSIGISAPYSAFDVPRTPTLFRPGQVIGLFATGLGMHDEIVGSQTSLASGPNGVPLHSASTLSNQFSVDRTGALVDPGASVGQVLARFPSHGIVAAPPNDFRYANGCKLTVPAAGHTVVSGGTPAILFGVNDTPADAQRLRSLVASGYDVRIVFGFGGSPCVEYSQPPVNH